MKLLDASDPFDAPRWRRVTIVGVGLGWALVEMLTGSLFWAILSGMLGLWCLWAYFLALGAPITSRATGLHKDKP